MLVTYKHTDIPLALRDKAEVQVMLALTLLATYPAAQRVLVREDWPNPILIGVPEPHYGFLADVLETVLNQLDRMGKLLDTDPDANVDHLYPQTDWEKWVHTCTVLLDGNTYLDTLRETGCVEIEQDPAFHATVKADINACL